MDLTKSASSREYKLFTTSPQSLWKRYLRRFPDVLREVYFLPEYYKLYENDDVEAQCFVYEDKGKIVLYPYLKTAVNCGLKLELDRRYYDIEGAYGYNGVITNTDDRTFLGEFADVFMDFCNRENIIAEFMRFNPILRNQAFSTYMDIEMVNKNIVVDLTMASEDIWAKSYEHCVRKNVKKAKDNNLYVESYLGSELAGRRLNEFLKLYYLTMDRNKADRFYYFDQSYFNNLCTLLGKNSFFFFALLGGKVISCELVVFNCKTAYSFLGGTLAEYFPLRPNNLLKHEIISKLKRLNFTSYCLGGGSRLGDSTYRYKKTFSKNGTVDFYIGKKIHNKKVYCQICNAWENSFPQKAQIYKNYFLKYKF